MHKLMITGNVGQNAIIRQGNDSEFMTFTVAVNKKYKNRDGVDVEKTTWYNCLYQAKSMSVAQYLTSGQRVLIEGEPEAKLYQAKNGDWQIDNSINVRGIELLGSPQGNKDQAPAQAEEQTAPEPRGQQSPPTKRESNGQFTKSEPAVVVTTVGNDDLPF